MSGDDDEGGLPDPWYESLTPEQREEYERDIDEADDRRRRAAPGGWRAIRCRREEVKRGDETIENDHLRVIG